MSDQNTQKEEYIWYDYCDCGGEYQGISGATFDCYPAFYPVQCKSCGKKVKANLYSECMKMGWKDNRKPGETT